MEKDKNIPSIYERMVKVMTEVKTVYKDGKMASQGFYRYVSHDMVAGALHEAIASNGIALHHSVERTIENFGGKPVIRTSLEVSFINSENPSDRITYKDSAFHESWTEKACGSALSYLYKYIMLKAFCLETSEDSDHDPKEKEKVKRESPKKAAEEISEEILLSPKHFQALTAVKEILKRFPEKLPKVLSHISACEPFLSSKTQAHSLKDLDRAPFGVILGILNRLERENKEATNV